MSYELLQPETLPEALDTLAQSGEETKVLAGGTAIVLLLQQKLITPSVLLSLGRLQDLSYIRVNSDTDAVHIGPLTLLRDVEQSSLIQERYPALAHACGEVGNVRVRNQATLGGNLAEADYASDPPAMLLALDASVTVNTASQSRSIPLSQFIHGFFTTALEPDELITDIVIPPLPTSSQMAYLKFKTRSSEDRPCLGVAALATIEDGTVDDLRVAIGAASDMPIRLPDIEALAYGQALSDELIDEIAEGYANQVETLDDLRGSAWYRSQMIRVHVRRALEQVRNGNR